MRVRDNLSSVKSIYVFMVLSKQDYNDFTFSSEEDCRLSSAFDAPELNPTRQASQYRGDNAAPEVIGNPRCQAGCLTRISVAPDWGMQVFYHVSHPEASTGNTLDRDNKTRIGKKPQHPLYWSGHSHGGCLGHWSGLYPICFISLIF